MFTCSKSIIKTEVHCAKFVQSWQERHQIKCVKLNLSKCFNILLIWLLSTLIIFIAIYVIPIVIPQFPSWFSASTPWFPTFFAFPPKFLAFPRYSHADSPHFHPIPRILTLILRILLILFSNFPFWVLQITSTVCNL